MFKISLPNFILISFLIIVVVGISYSVSMLSNNRDETTKQDENDFDQQESESASSSYEQYTEVDISDWKTYQNEEYGFEIKYPPYYYVRLLRDNVPAWGTFEVPILSIILSENPPGIGSKSTVYPNVSINVYEHLTIARARTYIQNEYNDITQKELIIGNHFATLLEWQQEVKITNQSIFIETSNLLFSFNADNFNTPLSRNTLNRILLHLKLLQ